jgi:RNA polymerase sigma-70 factor (ECF subfamily)
MVDELVNDTLLTVWDKAATFTATSKVSTWIFGIAYRKGLQGLRETDLPVEFDADTEEDSSELGPASQLEQQQLKKAVADGLQALSVEHRMVVTLTYFHGAGYREIAEIMDCPVDTVKTRMFHARRRLQRLLRDLEGDRP